MSGQDKIYQIVTDRILAELEKGIVPWHKPWNALPVSLSTGKPYRGINIFLLQMEAEEKGYTSRYWGTYDQLAAKAGMTKVSSPRGRGYRWASPDDTPRGVRRGEHSTIVVFWDVKHRKGDPARDEDPDKRYSFMLLRFYHVFNAEQADGIPEKYLSGTQNGEDIKDAQELLNGYFDTDKGPKLSHGGDEAFYAPMLDKVTLPPRGSFDSVEDYYSTAFHEATHSTGHKSRLHRPGVVELDHFGSDKYGQEELVAEMGAAMLNALTGVDRQIEASASYVGGWLRNIRGNPRMVVRAAAQAQKAADLIQGIEWSSEESEDEE